MAAAFLPPHAGGPWVRQPEQFRLRHHLETLQFGGDRQPLVKTDECERGTQLFLNQHRGGKLTGIRGAQGMPCQQQVRSRSNGEDIRYLIPFVGEGFEHSEQVATLQARKRPFTCPTFNRADNLGSCPGPGNDPVVFRQSITCPAAFGFRNDQRHQRRCIPVPQNRSFRSSANASEILTGNSNGGSSRIAAAPPRPGLITPWLISRSRAPWSSPAAVATSFATGLPRSRIWTSPPRRTSRT